MTILITGGWGYGNLGDEAILKSTLMTIKSIYSNENIIISTYDPDNTKKIHKDYIDECEVIESLHKKCYLKSFNGILNFIKYLFFLFLIKIGFGKLIRDEYLLKYIKADQIIFAGGGYYNDLWKGAFPIRTLEFFIAIACKKMNSNLKVKIIGQTIGPFRYSISRVFVKRILKHLDLIMLRDETSVNIAKSLGAKDVRLSGDTALLVGKYNKHKLLSEQKYIAITLQNFRGYASESNYEEKSSRDMYEEKIKNIVKELLLLDKSLEIKIVPSTSFDYEFNYHIFKEINDDRCKFLDIYNTELDEFIYILQNSLLCISTNMHPLIISSQAFVPVIGISYWYKMDDFMKSINNLNFTYRIDEFTDYDIIRAAEQILKYGYSNQSTNIEIIKKLVDKTYHDFIYAIKS